MINEKMFDIKKSGNPNIFIEMLLLKFMNDYIHSDINISQEIKSNTFMNIESKEEKKCLDSSELNLEFVSDNIKDVEKSTISEPITNNNKDNYDLDALRIENLLEVMKVRVNNTLAEADKQILKKAIIDMNIFNDYTFDDEIGYIACSFLDAKLRAASINSIIISYDYDSVVKQNLLELEKFTSIYNKLTNSNKKIAIITDEEWEIVKNNYIKALKDGHQYTIIDEPEIMVFKRPDENVIITNSAVELFGDIVEIE